MHYYPEFGKLLEQYLAQRDRSAAWLAQRLGVNPATVTRWRNGETRPNAPEMIIRIADVLGIHEQTQREELLWAVGYGFRATDAAIDPVDQTEPDSLSTVEGLSETITRQVDPPNPCTESSQLEVVEVQVDTTSSAGDTAAGHVRISIVLKGWYRQITERPIVQITILTVLTMTGIVLAMWFNFSHSGLGVSGLPVVAGVQYFAIDEWKNLSPGPSDYELLFTEGTRRVLYDKLSLAPALQGVARNSPQVTAGMRSGLNFWIEGDYQQVNGIQLTAAIFERDGIYKDTVSIHSDQPIDMQEANVCILDLQDQLARRILAVLNITLTQEVADALAQTPTHSCEALRLNNQAVALVMNGGFQNAHALLTRALTLDPNYADAHNNLGQVFYRQGDWASAVTHYRQAIALQSANAVFHYNLGVAYERQGNYPASVRAYQQAIGLDPIYVQALNNLGFTYLQKKNLTEALTLLNRGLEVAPDAYYLHKNLGRVYLEQNDADRAILELQRAIKLFGKDAYAEALYYLALAYQQQGQPQEACTALAQYLPVADKDEAQRAEQAKVLGTKLQCITK